MLSNRQKARYCHDPGLSKPVSARSKTLSELEVLSVELCKGQKALSSISPNISPTGKPSSAFSKAKKGCLVIGLLGTLTLGSAVSQAAPMDRSLSLYNIHTKENLSITYKRAGKYDRKALDKLNWFMRDWRNNQTIKMDPKLLDLMWEVHQDLGSKKPIHVVSSYRSQKTNKMLRKIGRKVALNSQHTKGRAVDVFFPDISTKKIRENALIREIGGVGYYPRSLSKGFVHIDTGSVRHWPRMHARTFARLFPYGKSKHRPRSYPSKAMYAKYRGKTPEPHIQMALASKNGNTPDLRPNQTIQVAALTQKKIKPVVPQPVLTKKSSKPVGPAPIILTSAKILDEKTQGPVLKKPENNKIEVQQLANLELAEAKTDPFNKPVAHGMKPITVAALEPQIPAANDPNNAPMAHGMKPVQLASKMDVKIIPAASIPGEKANEESLKPTVPEKVSPQKVEVAALLPLPEKKVVSDKPLSEIPIKRSEKTKPPLEIAFSQASLNDLGINKNILMPRVNRAIKGDLRMTSFYKTPSKPKSTASHRAYMGKEIDIALGISWDDHTGLFAA